MTTMALAFRGPDDLGDGPFCPAFNGNASLSSGMSSPDAGKVSGEVAADWLERLGAYLRRQHPVKTAEAVAAHCRGQVTAEQVRKWLALRATPSGVALLWLATCYGPSLLVSLFAPSATSADWATAMQAQRVDELGLRLVALRTELDGELARWR